MGWIEELVVWRAEHGKTLGGGRGLAGAAFNDVAIVDLAQSDAGWLMLQRAAHEMGAWWLSGFLLLDGRTINVGAVGSFVNHHGKVKAILRTRAVRDWEPDCHEPTHPAVSWQ